MVAFTAGQVEMAMGDKQHLRYAPQHALNAATLQKLQSLHIWALLRNVLDPADLTFDLCLA